MLKTTHKILYDFFFLDFIIYMIGYMKFECNWIEFLTIGVILTTTIYSTNIFLLPHKLTCGGLCFCLLALHIHAIFINNIFKLFNKNICTMSTLLFPSNLHVHRNIKTSYKILPQMLQYQTQYVHCIWYDRENTAFTIFLNGDYLHLSTPQGAKRLVLHTLKSKISCYKG